MTVRDHLPDPFTASPVADPAPRPVGNAARDAGATDLGGDRRAGLTRRRWLAGLGGLGGLLAAGPSLAQTCQIGPPPHEKGPAVWLDMDQVELDTAYEQLAYAPMMTQIQRRYASSSRAARERIGAPLRFAYGDAPIEGLDVYRAPRPGSPIFVFVHGGRWLRTMASDYSFAAEHFLRAGVNFVALDFYAVDKVNGDLRVLADQVRRGIAWVYRHADRFGGDRSRFYVGGHSSGGHLCATAMVTDWATDFGLPPDFIRGGLLMSGIYDLKPARLSRTRSAYIRFDDEMEQNLSPQRHLERLRAPVIVSIGTEESPEFQRQGRDFVTAVRAAGKSAELVVAPDYNHFELCESLGHPYSPNGLAAMRLLGIETGRLA